VKKGKDWDRKARLTFALACLKLARREKQRFGRQFMSPGESIYDSAIQYGGSIGLRLDEVIAVAKMNKQRRKSFEK
jgi:hypothetical protein